MSRRNRLASPRLSECPDETTNSLRPTATFRELPLTGAERKPQKMLLPTHAVLLSGAHSAVRSSPSFVRASVEAAVCCPSERPARRSGLQATESNRPLPRTAVVASVRRSARKKACSVRTGLTKTKTRKYDGTLSGAAFLRRAAVDFESHTRRMKRAKAGRIHWNTRLGRRPKNAKLTLSA